MENNNSNVYPLFREQQGHGQPYSAGATVPAESPVAESYPAPPAPQPYPTGGHPAPAGYGPAPQPAPFAQGGGHPPHTWDVSGQRPPFPPAEGHAHGAELVRRTGNRLPVRRRRRDEVDVVLRQERRNQLRRRAVKGGTWVGTRGWWVVRGAGISGRALWRIVWQPEEAADITKMAELQPTNARQARRELRRYRRIAVASLAGTGIVSYFALHFWGDDLVEALPWWSYPAAALVVVPVLGWVGRPEVVQGQEVEVSQAEDMPVSLRLNATEKGVVASLVEAFADVKIRAQVHGADRAAAGWGFTATISVLDPITEGRLEALERYLNTPVGGLVLSPVTRAARVRTLRLVLEDLLDTPVLAPQRSGLSVTVPSEIATRFDGGRLGVSLYALHVLLIGRTRSGKSGALHILVDVLTDAPNQVVVGIDLSGGPDLRSWEPALYRYVGGPDYLAAEKLLGGLVALVKDRTLRLGTSDHIPTPQDPGFSVVIDEYGRVAEHPQLREYAEFIVLYGAKVGVHLIAASQRKVTAFMGNQIISSQVHLKFYMGMAPEDALALPKEIREQGVRPQLFRQATPEDPADAGKAFVLGLDDPVPVLARFDRLDRAEAARRAAERSGFRPEPGRRDQEILDGPDTGGVPELLVAVREAVFVVASKAGRVPERAAGEEIAAYLAQQGRPIDKNALVRELREASGGLINRSRDTNLGGRNPKGFYLEDLDNAIQAVRDRQGVTAP